MIEEDTAPILNEEAGMFTDVLEVAAEEVIDSTDPRHAIATTKM